MYEYHPPKVSVQFLPPSFVTQLDTSGAVPPSRILEHPAPLLPAQRFFRFPAVSRGSPKPSEIHGKSAGHPQIQGKHQSSKRMFHSTAELKNRSSNWLRHWERYRIIIDPNGSGATTVPEIPDMCFALAQHVSDVGITRMSVIRRSKQRMCIPPS